MTQTVSPNGFQPPAAITPEAYARFVREIQRLTGLDLNAYKPDQLLRRLPVLLGRLGVRDLAEYVRLLAADPARLREFWDWVGIHVSEFFRDPAVFQFLERQILPDLRRRRALLRAWSAGCSIGAEAYSLAILLEEAGSGAPYHILATDVSPEVLRIGRSGGPYPSDLLRNVTPARRDRWFTATPDGYRIHPELTGRLLFAVHDLLRDPYPTALDLIICRNVTIYFVPAVRDAVYQRLAGALAPEGILLLGGSEAIARPAELGLRRIAPSCYRRVPEGTTAPHALDRQTRGGRP